MKNIKNLLAELERRKLLRSAPRAVLDGFLERMGLTSDIKEEDIGAMIDEVATTKFGSGLGLSDRFLTGVFKQRAGELLIESALTGPDFGDFDTLDISRIFFVYIQIHDRIVGRN